MHCLLTIAQSTLVPSLGCDCAGGQRPDSAHPFPEGELWKPKTAAISSLSPPPLILCSCLALPLFLSPSPSLWPVTWQRPCIKGNYRTMRGASQEFEELFFFFFFLNRNFTWQSFVISWVDHLCSCWNQKPKRKSKGTTQTKQYLTVTHCPAWLSTTTFSHISLTMKYPITCSICQARSQHTERTRDRA